MLSTECLGPGLELNYLSKLLVPSKGINNHLRHNVLFVPIEWVPFSSLLTFLLTVLFPWPVLLCHLFADDSVFDTCSSLLLTFFADGSACPCSSHFLLIFPCYPSSKNLSPEYLTFLYCIFLFLFCFQPCVFFHGCSFLHGLTCFWAKWRGFHTCSSVV